MASTVRVEDRVHAALIELAAEERRPIGRVLEAAVERYKKEKFWEGMRADFARLRADPDAWRGYQDEIALWDATSGDGLVDEEPYYSAAEEAEIDADYARTFGR